jgi:hypothetical protein
VTLVVVVPLRAGAQSPAPDVTPLDPCPVVETASPLPVALDEDAPQEAEPTPTQSLDPCPEPTPTPTTTPVPPDTLGPRPYGLTGLKKMFGKPCNSKANDARTFVPNAWGRGKDGYLYYHRKLFGKVHTDVIEKILKSGRRQAIDYGVWGYNCRKKTGGSSWSVHAWGAAIDTNTLRNPYGATKWIGKGANGKRYGRYIPQLYMAEDFYWGLNFRDPMHFQYVSGY